MIAFLTCVIALLAIGEFLLFGALAEAYRSLRQIRENAGLLDIPSTVDLGSALHRKPSEVGLWADLDSAFHEVVVYLDQRCGTCTLIAADLGGGIPKGMRLVFIASTAAEAATWIEELNIAPANRPRALAASADEVERQLGGLVTPLAVKIVNGRLASATTIPSVRQFYGAIPAHLALSPPDRAEVTTS